MPIHIKIVTANHANEQITEEKFIVHLMYDDQLKARPSRCIVYEALETSTRSFGVVWLHTWFCTKYSK